MTCEEVINGLGLCQSLNVTIYNLCFPLLIWVKLLLKSDLINITAPRSALGDQSTANPSFRFLYPHWKEELTCKRILLLLYAQGNINKLYQIAFKFDLCE